MAPLNFEKIFSLFQPKWDWIQVEVTTHCNAACIYCPRTVFRQSWQDQHLSLETFKKLKSVLPRTDLVHLQGWGEPFLHPEFFEIAAVAKQRGCKVGTTTNAMLLNEERIRKVVETGIDILAFSLAGTGEDNDLIRKGTSLKRVLKAIETLNREKSRQGKTTPEIHVAYMLFRSGMGELEALPSLLKGLGVSQVVISTLDFVPTEILSKEALIPTTQEEYQELRSSLDRVVEAGRDRGLSIFYYLISPKQRRQVCTENVQKALCISSDGAVTPCVYTNLRVSGVYYDLQGKQVSYQRIVFGNIKEKDVKDIWKERSYSAFRRSFYKGDLAPTCQKCSKIWQNNKAERGGSASLI
jgi:MoaA/NifB/PqqE/SkfB family radical SAM enzyme